VVMALDLTGRRALVTGGGQGVGRGIALGFAAAGADVVVNDIDLERAEAVVDEVRGLGGSAVASAFDVTDHTSVHSAVDAVEGVDVLVNNAGNAGVAGFGDRGSFAESDPADWQPYLCVNLYGVMHCCRAVLPGMIAKGWGRVITIVSDAGRTGDAGGAAYSAAKAGAAGLSRALARENGRHGITVNNISLGTMRTPATEPLWADPDDPVAKAMLRSYVVRRPGEPDDVAFLAVFLASPQASWITGQTYPLNGGFSFAL
jgi:NAD(P)-dependent dehydrogenase (short-subunit alcohol dehydrogenase family)